MLLMSQFRLGHNHRQKMFKQPGSSVSKHSPCKRQAHGLSPCVAAHFSHPVTSILTLKEEIMH